MGAVAAGLALGLAFHCKEPLGIFILPVMAALYKPGASWRAQWGRLAIVPAMLAGAVAAYKGYDWYKFPPGSTAGHAALLKYYVPVWSNDPLFGLVALAISPAAGVLFYYPPVLIGIAGFRSWYRSERLFCLSLCAAIAVFVLFICSLTFFKGDTSWGPRYLTPVFAVLWIMAPAGSRQMRTWMVVALLATGSLVQLEALSIDPRRLYMEHGLPSWFYVAAPELYFHPAISHLLNRPREILDVLSANDDTAVCYSSARPPSFPFFMMDAVDNHLTLYHHTSMERGSFRPILDTFRPWWWWASLRGLGARSLPVDVKRTATLLTLLSGMGLILMILGVGDRGHRRLAADHRGGGQIGSEP